MKTIIIFFDRRPLFEVAIEAKGERSMRHHPPRSASVSRQVKRGWQARGAAALIYGAGALLASWPCAAQEAQAPLRAAVQEMHQADANGQWFSFSVALVGVLPGVAVGSLGATGEQLPGLRRGNGLVSGSSLALLGTSAGLLVHGLMRVDERQANAVTSRALLDDPEALQSAGLLYLQGRAHQARATRLVGGSLTLLQGASLASLGLGSLQEAPNSTTLGVVLLVAGALTMGVGAVHFLGDTHADRLVRRAQGERREVTWRWSPSVGLDEGGRAQGQLWLSTFF
jgi:hypothetical protein